MVKCVRWCYNWYTMIYIIYTIYPHWIFSIYLYLQIWNHNYFLSKLKNNNATLFNAPKILNIEILLWILTVSGSTKISPNTHLNSIFKNLHGKTKYTWPRILSFLCCSLPLGRHGLRQVYIERGNGTQHQHRHTLEFLGKWGQSNTQKQNKVFLQLISTLKEWIYWPKSLKTLYISFSFYLGKKNCPNSINVFIYI